MKTNKKIILIIICALLILVFSLNSRIVIKSIKYSLELCYNSVIPSLFPFFVLSEFFVSLLACTKLNPTVYLFICGLITGFPNGTKAVCRLYDDGVISKSRAVKLLYCTANASPAYVVSFIGLCILKSKTIGLIILLAQTAAALLCALSFKAFSRQRMSNIRVINITETACSSITGSVSGCLNVCGYIIFSGVIADIMSAYIFIPNSNIKAILIGLVEITRGVSILKPNGSASIITIALIVGFSGVSVILQCISCAVKSKLPIKPILLGKLIYSFLMPMLTYCLLIIVPITYENVFNPLSSLITVVFIVFLAIFLYIFFDKSYKRLYNK